MPHQVSVDDVRTAGLEAGLHRVGVASAEPFADVRRALDERKAAGLHAGMQFTYRNPARSTEPRRTLAAARSIVVGALAYAANQGPAPPPGRQARVARYAVDDHYGALRDGLAAIAELLSAEGYEARVVADDNALVDRAAAHRAGLGWFGKNANLLLPGAGSWFVLGSVLTDAVLQPAESPVADGCGACTRCLDGCPTGAIVAPGVVDARRCLAWLLQAEGDFPLEHRAALGDRIYGCDDCQEVCPPSRRAQSDGPEITADRTWLDLVELLALDDAALLARVGRWYIPRREPRYVRRNALVALGNVGSADDPLVVATLERYLRSPDDLLARHADWAARSIGMPVAEPA